MIEPRHRLEGIASAKEWAETLGVNVETVRRWTATYGIPYHDIGREKWIAAADLWAKLPRKGGAE